MRNLAEKRHNDWTKAIRKHRIDRQRAPVGCNAADWYSNLHQYSKNKIHCSCPLCRAKSNDRNAKYGSKVNWSIADQRKIDSMDEQIEEFEREGE